MLKKILLTAIAGVTLAFSSLAEEKPAPEAAQPAPEAAQPAPEAAQPAPEAAQPAPAATHAATPSEITRDVHGDWQIRCLTKENTQCFLYQLVLSPQNTPLLEVTLIPIEDTSGKGAKILSNIVTPLNTVLGKGLITQVDEQDPTREPYDFCSPTGCYVRTGLDEASIESYKNAKSLKAVLFNIREPNNGIEIGISLNGFSDAYDALMKIEAENKK